MKKTIAAFLIMAALWLLMLPLGSFILDPALLLLIGIIIALVSAKLLKQLGRRRLVPALAVPTIFIFYLGSLSLYFNLPQADWLHRFAALFPLIGESPTGFNFMLNSGILTLPYLYPEEAPFTLHLLSGVLFTLYPLWLYLGIKLGFRLMRRPGAGKKTTGEGC